MTEANGTFKAVSPDPEQAYRESIEQLRDEGMAPDELKFQFQCQQCGLRCCMAPHVGLCWIILFWDVYSLLIKNKIRN